MADPFTVEDGKKVEPEAPPAASVVASPAEPDIFSPELYKSEAYTFLQLVVGLIALCLPATVAIVDGIAGQGIRGSISAYYYGRAGGMFVGALCAMAVFFLAYDFRSRPGFEADNRLSNAAALFAVGVAWCPTKGTPPHNAGTKIINVIHLTSAGLLFICLAAFSLYHFTKCEEGESYPLPKTNGDRWKLFVRAWKRAIFNCRPKVDPHEPDKVKRRDATVRRRKNLAHRVCGWLIVASMIGIAINGAIHGNLMYWLESVAVMSFGVSWLVKSDWIPWWQTSETKTQKLAIKKAREALMAAYREEIGDAKPTTATVGAAADEPAPPPVPAPSGLPSPTAAPPPAKAPAPDPTEFVAPAKRSEAMKRAKRRVDAYADDLVAQAAEEVHQQLAK